MDPEVLILYNRFKENFPNHKNHLFEFTKFLASMYPSQKYLMGIIDVTPYEEELITQCNSMYENLKYRGYLWPGL